MKYVFSNSKELGHLWAHQTQSHAKAGNVSFNGNAFVSYSTVIAMVVDSPSGERAYLLTHHSYSNSTSKHQNIAWRAIPSAAKRFYVPVVTANRHYRHSYPEVSSDHLYNAELWAKEIATTLKDASESREPKRSRLILEASKAQSSAQEYIDFFAVNFILPAFPYTAEQLTQLQSKADAREAALEARRIIRYAARDAQWKAARLERERINALTASERIADWINGKCHSSNLYDVPTMLRVTGDMVETSRGASFPLSHAKRGLALVESVIARGEAWQRNGHTCHLGHYQIDSIDADGTVKAGCHLVSYEAIARIRESIISAPDAMKAGE